MKNDIHMDIRDCNEAQRINTTSIGELMFMSEALVQPQDQAAIRASLKDGKSRTPSITAAAACESILNKILRPGVTKNKS